MNKTHEKFEIFSPKINFLFFKSWLRSYLLPLRTYWNLVRKLGIYSAMPLRQLPISSEILGCPKGFYRSVSEWLYRTVALDQREQYYVEIEPKDTIYRTEPKTLNDKIHCRFRYAYRIEVPASFIVIIPSGRVSGCSDGTIITQDDMVLSELSEGPRLDSDHPIFLKWKLPKVSYIEGKVVSLLINGSGNYFHWMFDFLPRIDLLNRSGLCIDTIDKFLINYYDQPFQKETLLALNIPQEKILKNQRNLHLKLEQLIVPSKTNGLFYVSQFTRDFINDLFLNGKKTNNLQQKEKIYISREDAQFRKVLNEDELVNFLSTLGFEKVSLNYLSISEQALLFSSAKMIIAPHGAGLTNLIFCQPGTKVIELFPPKYVNECFWAICAQFCLKYYYLIGRGKYDPEHANFDFRYDDIWVDINLMNKTLELAGFSS